MEDGRLKTMPLHPPSAILHPRRLLVRGVNWLGDAVMTTPALFRLREALPHTHITLLTPEKLKSLWSDHPHIDEIMTFAPVAGLLSVANMLREGAKAPASVRSSSDRLPLDEASARVRRETFDLALVLPNSPRAALEVWLAGIPRRVGYARPWRNWLLTQTVPSRPNRGIMRKRSVAEIRRCLAASPAVPSPSPAAFGDFRAHQTNEYLHLAAVLGADATPVAPFLFVRETLVEEVRNQFGLSPDVAWLGINPGAEYGPAKRWPKESFIAAVNEIHALTGCGLIVFGGPADAPLAAEICAALRAKPALVRDLSGRTSLRELCAALKICRVLLTNDTGPMHVAAAVGTPVVVPFGSTSPELTCPGLPGAGEHRFLRVGTPCAPCFLRECPVDFRCLKGLPPERVSSALLEVWAARNPA